MWRHTESLSVVKSTIAGFPSKIALLFVIYLWLYPPEHIKYGRGVWPRVKWSVCGPRWCLRWRTYRGSRLQSSGKLSPSLSRFQTWQLAGPLTTVQLHKSTKHIQKANLLSRATWYKHGNTSTGNLSWAVDWNISLVTHILNCLNWLDLPCHSCHFWPFKLNFNVSHISYVCVFWHGMLGMKVYIL